MHLAQHVLESVDNIIYTAVLVAAAIPASLKAQGYSNARAFSATQLTQNPNAFFYRNVAPGQQQVTPVYVLTVVQSCAACLAWLLPFTLELRWQALAACKCKVCLHWPSNYMHGFGSANPEGLASSCGPQQGWFLDAEACNRPSAQQVIHH